MKLHRPGVYLDPGVFDDRSYLERQGIYRTGTIRKPRLMTVLDPGRAGHVAPRKNDRNNDSVVLLIKEASATALLMGDIERAIPVPDQVDVLKVPHHGIRGVQVRPKVTVRVISVGANNPFGHPHESSLPALRTEGLGAVTVNPGKLAKGNID